MSRKAFKPIDWDAFLEHMKQCDPPVWAILSNTPPNAIGENDVCLDAPNSFFHDIVIKEKFTIERHLNKFTGRETTITVEMNSDLENPSIGKIQKKPPKTPRPALKIVPSKQASDIARNIQTIIKQHSDHVAHLASCSFTRDFRKLVDMYQITSPIEQAFLSAWLCVLRFNYYPIAIHPQSTLGEYRVDFLIRHNKEAVVVECDGHDWHERTKEQRAYENARNRFLQKKGYKVFHYTGSEIISDPLRVAAEVLAEIVHTQIEAIIIPGAIA